MKKCKESKRRIYLFFLVFLFLFVISNFINIHIVFSASIGIIGFYLLFQYAHCLMREIKKTGKDNIDKVIDEIGIP